MIKAQTYIKLSAPADTNGNPRRLYIVHEMNPLNPDAGATRRAIIVENYNGNQEVRSRFPMAINMTEIAITPAEYKRWKQVKKAQEAGEIADAIEAIKKAEPVEKFKKKTLEKLGTLAADFARTGEGTIQEGAEMALQRYYNRPNAFQ